MFKIMLKGNEFYAFMNSDKVLELISVENALFHYKLNKEELRLESSLEDDRLLIVKLTKQDVDKLEEVRMKIVNKVKESVDLMQTKKDTIILIESAGKVIALPKSVYENLQLSVKFKEGMLFVINKQLNLDSLLTYESLQDKVTNSTILKKSKFVNSVNDDKVKMYETSYDSLLNVLSNNEEESSWEESVKC